MVRDQVKTGSAQIRVWAPAQLGAACAHLRAVQPELGGGLARRTCRAQQQNRAERSRSGAAPCFPCSWHGQNLPTVQGA